MSNNPTPPNKRIDPVEELSELLIVMRRNTATAGKALDRIEHNRFNLLVVHAVAALLIGILMMASAPAVTGPAWALLDNIPLFPYSFAGVLCLGGLVLLPGSIARNRRMEYAGLAILYLWYLALAIGFAIPSFQWAFEAFPTLWNDEPTPKGQPTLYAWVVYLHLALIMRVHMWTLSKIRKNILLSRASTLRQQGEADELAKQLHRWTEKPPPDPEVRP